MAVMRTMGLTRRWAAVLCCLVSLSASAATPEGKEKNEPVARRMAMMGFALSFSDSVACLTDVQVLDSIWLDARKFLVDRSLYSLQLQMHLEKKGYKNTICSVFFDKNPRKLQRLWRKMHKRYAGGTDLRYHDVPEHDFRFRAEEYRPIITLEEDATP